MDLQAIKKRKTLTILIFTANISAFVYCYCKQVIAIYGFQQGTTEFHWMTITASICDYVSSVTLQVGYICLMRKLIESETCAKLSWALVIFPGVYIATTVVGIISALQPTQPSFVVTVFNICNALLATCDFVTHGFISYKIWQMVDRDAMKPRDRCCVAFPWITCFLFLLVCLWGALDPDIGDGPAYTFWSLDIVAFLFAEKYVGKTINPESKGNLKSCKTSESESRRKSVRDISRPSVSEMHHEIELGIVIGKNGRNIEQSDADAYIESIVLCLDMTARNLQNKAKREGNPWTVSKGYDTFTPVGRLVPRGKINLQDIELKLFKNGGLKQHGNTKDMVFNFNRIIEHVSSIMKLEKGDLILTGTPEGVGPVEHGDELVGKMYSQDNLLDTICFKAYNRK
ncbi:hypothetical protein HDV01_006631 [Terramyces sp. JEL0728]|nr:hypothetical protein HDV01_006631 [Terramyces sp. JEL0728]